MFNHRVGINKTTLRDHIKKRMPRAGDSLSTTKPTLRDHPKSCPNDRNYIAGYGCPVFKYIVITASPITTDISLKIRVNANRNQSLIRQRMNSAQPQLHTRSPAVHLSKIEQTVTETTASCQCMKLPINPFQHTIRTII